MPGGKDQQIYIIYMMSTTPYMFHSCKNNILALEMAYQAELI